jgi:type II secretory pathway component GspD/PulD (secretin)
VRFRFPFVLLAAGLCVIPALAEKKKADNAPETGPQPAIVAPIIPAAHQEPEIYDPNPTERMTQLLNESEDLRRAREEMHRYWMNNQPKVLTYEKASCDRFASSDGRSVTKVYQVADLVVPLPTAGDCLCQPTQPLKTCEVELMEKITTAVQPKSWTKSGGKGSIDYYPMGMALVVNQEPDVQEMVELFLEKLRKTQDQQVVTELRIITVSDKWYAKSGLAKELVPTAKSPTPCKFIFRESATKLFRACKEQDASMQCLSSPMITCLNGQAGRVRVGEVEHFVTGVTITYVDGQLTYTPKNVAHDLGLDFTVEPTVSADTASIGLTITGSMKEHGVLPVPSTPVATRIGQTAESSPIAQEIQEPKIITRTFDCRMTIPDGGSALIYGGKATIERTGKDAGPMLSDIPHLNELFRNVGRQSETNHLLVLVSSHIVSPDIVAVECVECAKADQRLAKLLAQYGAACKQGKVEDARRLAIECLAIDPMCFAKK